jgi:alpha-L-glutamate ligase-like protein
MNARDQLYASRNSAEAKKFGFSKIRAKEFLKKHGIQVAALYGILKSVEDVRSFHWRSISGGFAMKPSNGSAGKGVLVIKQKLKNRDIWESVEGKRYTANDLRLHASDILEGQYSTWGAIANVIIEERIPIHPDFEPYVKFGTPDVRVIVYNKIPVMSMTRLPTEASGGRANLDQGAVGLGIDMGTGNTLHGVSGKKSSIQFLPGTNQPVDKLQIPFWIDILKTAVRASNATGLMFMGADIFVHPEKGPMVAEVNSYPGLSIQIANHAGLRRRLERVEDLEARNVNHAVKIGQALFAENYPLVTIGDSELTVVSPKEEVEIFGEHGQKRKGLALINTGREFSAIAIDVAKELGLADQNNLLWSQYVEGEGKEFVVEVEYKLRDRVRKTTMIVSKRINSAKYLMHIGRKDLTGLLVGEVR